MSANQEVIDNHKKIISSLMLAIASVEQVGDGYIAKASISTENLSDQLKDNLQTIIVGEWNSDKTIFHALVFNNRQEAIIFSDIAEAKKESMILADNIVRRYCYGLFAECGIAAKPPESNAVTMHFFKTRA